MPTTKLLLGRDTSGAVTYTLQQSNETFSCNIAENKVATFVVPDDGYATSYEMRVGADLGFNVYVSTTGTFSLPDPLVNPVFAPSNFEANIAQYIVYPGQTIYVRIVNAGAITNLAMVTLGLYAKS